MRFYISLFQHLILLAKWFLSISFLLAFSRTRSRSGKGKWESPLFLSLFFNTSLWMNISKCLRFNSIDRMKRKTNEKTKKAKQSVHRKTRLLQSRYCCSCSMAHCLIVVLILAVSLSLCAHSDRNYYNNGSGGDGGGGDEMENWWSRENFATMQKLANIYFSAVVVFCFIQSKMGNNMHALVLCVCLLLNWIRLPRP